ncbi:MAG: ABC transporter substrate-binding protein, partial [Alphaproteobacteria bacterium]|nr:ABC transporter substrate-binding protein [Alphaproteobacteria bacterium]
HLTTRLKIAVGAYDRTLPLMAGLVGVDDVVAEYVTAPLEEIFARAFDDQAYDITELSFSNYLYLTSTGNCPYIGLPVFPSRSFRHSTIFIRTDRGIRGPRDLAGRTVGVREFSMTAALVARGVLEDDFGVRAADVRWRYGPADAGDSDPIVRMKPHGIELEPLAGGSNLSDALRDGTIDALVAYKPPLAFLDGAPNVDRLFVDYEVIEADYARRTGIFPIMHLLGIQRELAERDPGLCLRVCDAFEASRRYAVERTNECQAPFTSLPWAPNEAERSRRVLGDNFWSYGVDVNRPALESLCRYSYAQGISTRPVMVDELFAPTTLSWAPG